MYSPRSFPPRLHVLPKAPILVFRGRPKSIKRVISSVLSASLWINGLRDAALEVQYFGTMTRKHRAGTYGSLAGYSIASSLGDYKLRNST
jgi:hypothetical protein